jgi:hypothetical protein
MKHLRKFNEGIGNTQKLKCNDFYEKYKNIVDFDETNYDQGYEPTKNDLLSEIGDLCNEMDMTRSDVKWVLDNHDCSFDVDGLLQITYDEWMDENEIDPSLTELVKDILNAAKLDVDAIEESDPEFISYIANMIKMWHDKKDR